MLMLYVKYAPCVKGRRSKLAIADIVFLLIIGIGCLAVTGCLLIWRGVIWLSFLSGVLWFLFGGFFLLRTQEGVVIMEFQEYMGMLLVGVSIALFLSPLWLRARNMDAEIDPPSDIDIWKANRKEHRAKINEMKNARRDRYGDGDSKD